MFASDDVAWSEPSILSGLARKVEMQINIYGRTFKFRAIRNSWCFSFSLKISPSSESCPAAFEVFHISPF